MDVRLRALKESDLEQVMNWRMDADITRYMKTDPKLTLEIQQEWFRRIRSDPAVKYWMIETGGKPAGIIHLEDTDWEAGITSWGYYMGEKKSRSFQLAMALEMSLYDYVFDELKFREIRSEVLSLNRAVIKLHQVCGNAVIREGKGEVIKKGVAYDVTHLALERDVWLEKRKSLRYEKIDFAGTAEYKKDITDNSME